MHKWTMSPKILVGRFMWNWPLEQKGKLKFNTMQAIKRQ